MEVRKREMADRTVTEASILADEERVRAMAEILGGTGPADAAMEHARKHAGTFARAPGEVMGMAEIASHT